MQLPRGPGWVVSAVVHGALLATLLVVLPDAKKFTDAQETVPVEILTEEQVNQIVKGDKQVKKDRPDQRADKISETRESNPKPPIAEAKKNIPTPPPPLKRLPDPGEDDTPKPAEPAQKVAALPPPRPEPQPKLKPAPKPVPPPPPRPVPPKRAAVTPPPKPEPPKPEPPKPLSKEAVIPPVPPQRPKPPPKPEPRKVAAAEPEKPDTEPPEKATPPMPLPPQRPRNLARVAKPKDISPKRDRLAKLIADSKNVETPNRRTGARPKSGDESNDSRRQFDASAINRLLSKEAPQRRSSSGQRLQREARRGSQTASAARMSPSMWGQLDGLMQEQYKRCWSYLGIAGRRYIPQIKVAYSPGGRLTSTPVLLNPPSDPSLKPLAESALRAVRKCDPLRIPPQFAPYYEQWKARILRFDPEEMLG